MTSRAGPSPAPEETRRLFIGLTLPADVRDVLLSLPQRINGVFWSHSEHWHLTLRFLGDVPLTQMDRLLERLGTVQVEPFVLPVEGVGTFPPNRPPRVVWVGTGTGHPRLYQLRQRIDDAILAAGVNMDVRSFHPHVTLARCNEHVGAGLAPWLHRHADFVAPPFRVQSFELYQSELKASGAVHTVVQTFPLQRES